MSETAEQIEPLKPDTDVFWSVPNRHGDGLVVATGKIIEPIGVDRGVFFYIVRVLNVPEESDYGKFKVVCVRQTDLNVVQS